jgi:hypothetical protein
MASRTFPRHDLPEFWSTVAHENQGRRGCRVFGTQAASMALCYNFTRVLNILGFEGFVTALAKALLSRQNLLAAITDALP